MIFCGSVFFCVFTSKSRTDLGFENVETWNFHVYTQISMNIFDSQLELFFFGFFRGRFCKSPATQDLDKELDDSWLEEVLLVDLLHPWSTRQSSSVATSRSCWDSAWKHQEWMSNKPS